MKQTSTPQNQMLAGTSRSAATSALGQSKWAIDTAPDEIAQRAYFSYVNEGSLPGREEQHWMEAEVQLHAEITNGSRPHRSS